MTVVLKPGFAPIEQYQTRGQGPYTDLYAICATLYYCITGKVPPASPERLTITFDNQPDPLVPPSALGVSMAPEQEQILMWGLSLQPSVRPQNMEMLASRLEKAVVSGTRTFDGQTVAGRSGRGCAADSKFYHAGAEKKKYTAHCHGRSRRWCDIAYRPPMSALTENGTLR